MSAVNRREPKKIHTPILETQRLIMRPITLDDGPAILTLRSDPENMRFVAMTPYQDLERAQRFILAVTSDVGQGEVCFWGICLKETQELIGTICLWSFSDDFKSAEVGYELLTRYQGQGLMSEALKSVIAFGFKKLKMSQIIAITHQDNKASTGLLNHFKFHFVDMLVNLHPETEEGPEMALYLLVKKR